MKLIGYTVRRRSAGIFDVHLPLNDLTVLLGANDAGKSTILRALHEDLGGGPEHREWGDHDGGAIFVELTEFELGLLLPCRSGSGMSPNIPRWDFGDYGYHLGDGVTDATPEAYAGALATAAVDAPASFAIVLDALQTSRTVCLEPAGRRDGAPDFEAHWCLPPMSVLDAEVVDALRESHLLRFRRERSQAAAETAKRLPFRMKGAAVAHLLVDAAPVLVAPLRWSTVVHPPRPLIGPAPFPDLVDAIGDAVSSLVKTGRFQPRDVLHATPLDSEEKAQRVAPRLWLMRTEPDDGWQIDPLASAALRIVEAEARRLLPMFVTERYELGVAFREVDRWFVEHPIRVDLTPTGSGASSHRSFDIARVADGFRLWLQLALVGGVEELARLTAQLAPVIEEIADEASDRRGAEARGDYEDLESPPGPSADVVLSDALDAIAAFDGRPLDELAVVSDLHAYARAHSARHVVTGPTRVLIVDEPERHLHPRLARQAAGWLADVVRDSASPVVAASHATQFLALAEEVQIVLVRRSDGRVSADPMSSSEAETLSRLSDALGLDQGELLMMYSCVLLVEGEHDKVALEGIFGPELRAAGVLVLPLRGGASAGLFDSEILWRFTTAPTMMFSDNLDPELVRLAAEDPEEALRRIRASNVGEEGALQAALRAGRAVGKELIFMAHPARDLILALDENVITSVYGEYPGHKAALAAYEKERAEATGRAPQIKPTYDKLYKIPNHVSTYEKLAVAHAEAGARPPALEAVVDRAAGLARTFRAQSASPAPTAEDNGPPS